MEDRDEALTPSFIVRATLAIGAAIAVHLLTGSAQIGTAVLLVMTAALRLWRLEW